MGPRLLLVCALLAVTAGGVAIAQDASQNATAQNTPTEAMIYVQDLTPSDLGNTIRDILITRINDKFNTYNLHAAGNPIEIDTPESTDADYRLGPLLSQAVPPQTDLVVAAIFRILQTEVDIQFILLDPKQKTVLGGVLSRARSGLTVFTSVDTAVNDLDPVLQQYISNRYQYKPPEGVVNQITIDSSLEGEEVFFAGRDVGKVEGGVLNVPYTPFPIGSKVRIDMVKPGYHSEESIIDLPSAVVKTQIPALDRESHFSAGLDWAFGEALGFGVTGRIYWVPDWTYLQLDSYQELIPHVKPGFYDERAFDFGASFGQYLFLSYRSPVRVSLSFGAGVIFTSLQGYSGSNFTDLYLNLLSPSVEANLSGWHVYLQPQLKYTLGLGDNLLGRGWLVTTLNIPVVNSGLPPIAIGVFRTW